MNRFFITNTALKYMSFSKNYTNRYKIWVTKRKDFLSGKGDLVDMCIARAQPFREKHVSPFTAHRFQIRDFNITPSLKSIKHSEVALTVLCACLYIKYSCRDVGVCRQFVNKLQVCVCAGQHVSSVQRACLLYRGERGK